MDYGNVDRAADALQQVIPRVRRFLARGLQDEELTLQQLQVLSSLAGGARSSGAIAAELAIRLPTLTGLVAPLCSRGLIVRQRDPGNRRSIVLELTAAGQALSAHVYAIAHTRATLLLAVLTPDERDDIIGALNILDRAVAAHDAARHAVAHVASARSQPLAQNVQVGPPSPHVHHQKAAGKKDRSMSSRGRLHE